jgi:hypothetical protein
MCAVPLFPIVIHLNRSFMIVSNNRHHLFQNVKGNFHDLSRPEKASGTTCYNQGNSAQGIKYRHFFCCLRHGRQLEDASQTPPLENLPQGSSPLAQQIPQRLAQERNIRNSIAKDSLPGNQGMPK